MAACTHDKIIGAPELRKDKQGKGNPIISLLIFFVKASSS